MNLAAMYVALGDEPRARRELKWILERHPDNPTAQGLMSQLPPPAPSSP
jgi:hypothetical protein